MQIPFSPFPYPLLKSISQRFIPIGWKLGKLFPNLEIQLQQANIEIELKEYLAIMVFLAAFYFFFFSFLFALALSKITENFLLLGITMGIIFAFLMLIQLSMYPIMKVRKKQRGIEKNLLFALRTMLIEIKSGVTLFDAMQLIGNSTYGALSAEFKKTGDEINTGTTYADALQRLATNNPSQYFRKAIWQIVDGMKAGGDISSIIKETVKSAARDQRIAISHYGAELRLLSLVYMMIGVIAPVLGSTFLIVLGSFPQLKITEFIFEALLGGIILTEFLYIGIIKSRRPTIMT